MGLDLQNTDATNSGHRVLSPGEDKAKHLGDVVSGYCFHGQLGKSASNLLDCHETLSQARSSLSPTSTANPSLASTTLNLSSPSSFYSPPSKQTNFDTYEAKSELIRAKGKKRVKGDIDIDNDHQLRSHLSSEFSNSTGYREIGTFKRRRKNGFGTNIEALFRDELPKISSSEKTASYSSFAQCINARIEIKKNEQKIDAIDIVESVSELASSDFVHNEPALPRNKLQTRNSLYVSKQGPFSSISDSEKSSNDDIYLDESADDLCGSSSQTSAHSSLPRYLHVNTRCSSRASPSEALSSSSSSLCLPTPLSQSESLLPHECAVLDEILEDYICNYSRPDLLERVWLGTHDNDGFWDNAHRSLPQRPFNMVYFYIRNSEKLQGREEGKWNSKTDVLLRALVQKCGPEWREIGHQLKRSPQECKERLGFIKDIERATMDRIWSIEDLSNLSTLVNRRLKNSNCAYNWTTISLILGNKWSSVECKEKWLEIQNDVENNKVRHDRRPFRHPEVNYLAMNYTEARRGQLRGENSADADDEQECRSSCDTTTASTSLSFSNSTCYTGSPTIFTSRIASA